MGDIDFLDKKQYYHMVNIDICLLYKHNKLLLLLDWA